MAGLQENCNEITRKFQLAHLQGLFKSSPKHPTKISLYFGLKKVNTANYNLHVSLEQQQKEQKETTQHNNTLLQTDWKSRILVKRY